MFTTKVLTGLILIIIISNVNCAKILGIFSMPSKSHHILGSRLLKALAERGHEVTMLSPYPFKHKVENYRDIFLEEMLQYKEDNMQAFLKHNISFFEKMKMFSTMFRNMSEIVLSHKEVQKLKTEKFDLVIQFVLFTDSFLGLAHHFGAPVVLLSTFGSSPLINLKTGNTAPPSYVPTNAFPAEMTFYQRLLNTLSNWYSYTVVAYMTESREQAVLSKYFPEAPSLQELLSNVSLVLMNTHYSIESPRPYVPNMIQIGGFHIEEPKELPPEIKTFLDGASEGAIFFSLGSNVKILSLPQEKVQAIIKVFGELNMRVLFKSEETLPNLPKNIKMDKWLPQNDILAHPNVKLFVSHGGMLSTIEAVYHGVPVVGIPIFGDQLRNIAEATINGYAIEIKLDELNEEVFRNAIQGILSNPKYRENIQLRSSLIRDQPLKPLDTAIFWVEHVIKYKGAAHLKNVGSTLPLYKYFLLDVLAFITAAILVILAIVYVALKKMVHFVTFLVLRIRSKKKKE